ncbi:MAG: STAS-like domain-containing protein [Thermoanaerobaculia bacterium]
MEKRFTLAAHGKTLWTRDTARRLREELDELLSASQPGDTIILEMKGVDAFDFSFANEFFGKSLLALPRLYPQRFLVVQGLNTYTRENLVHALESLGLAMIEKKGRVLSLIGKVHPADVATFDVIASKRSPLTAATLSDTLGVGITAVNERLTKLTNLGLVRRRTGASAAGREQYEYSVLA